MTMTKKIIPVLALLLLFSTTVYAEDVDLSVMTPAEVQEYITELQNQTEQPQQQASVVTIRTDPELAQRLDLLQSELGDLKSSYNQMQERFNRLAQDTGEAILEGNKQVVSEIEVITQDQITISNEEMKDYIDYRTNPVRQNAPSIGVFLILTAAFLLWASRQYKLTNRGKQ